MNAQVLQLLISVGGIAVMVALCWALFGRAATKLPGVDALGAQMARDIPGFRAGAIAHSRNEEVALIEDIHDGSVYLVLARGDGLVIRKMSRGLGVMRDGKQLALRLRDFTLKDASIDLPDADYWETKLKGLAA